MTMASLNKNALGSDDEDDLESLRLAALKSLKPKLSNENHNKPITNCHLKSQSYKPSTFGAAQPTRHHRSFRNNSGRLGRNGINPRARTNPNLISIQTVDQNETKEIKDTISSDIPKLILPQDRYHKPNAVENISKESSGNKFDRYDNSDDSGSDSDEQASKVCRRERQNSLELLMADLENEINLLGGDDDDKLQKTKDDEIVEEIETNEDKETNEINVDASDTLIISETDPDLIQGDEIASPVIEKISPDLIPSKSRSRSPFLSSEKSQNCIRRKSRTKSRSPINNQYRSPYRSPKRSRSPPRKRYSPNLYPRPLSPLTLNTEVLNTITMAPLSPRSAAFVLENRQILARRQMSPRRSLSRESSLRRSISPKRNKSPRRRSRTPRKRSNSPPRKRSISPRNNHSRRSPNYPNLKRNHSNSPTCKSVYKRLVSRPNSRNVSPPETQNSKRKRTSRSISLSLSPSPDRNYHKRPLNETTGHIASDVRNKKEKPRKEEEQKVKQEEKSLDPVLEARRRKFESPVQIGNNGIIKLKVSKTTDSMSPDLEKTDDSQLEEIEEQDETEEVLDLNPNIDDLWTDEESDNENEGRFKSKPSLQSKGVSILRFSKMMEKQVSKKPSLQKDNNDHRTDKRYKRLKRRRSRTPSKMKTNSKSQKELDRNSLEKKKIKTGDEKINSKTTEDEKKKEKTSESITKSSDVLKTLQIDKNVRRKVKIQNIEPDLNIENNDEPEIIIENDEDCPVSKEEEGDLRAELSRRRAQRLNKTGSIDPTRLLKTALKEVVPKRSSIKQSKITKGSSSSADRRVLILKRLTSNPDPQLVPTTKVHKDGKLPIHMRLGSSNSEVPLEEPIRSERKSKRPRLSRRKNQAVQV